MDRPLTRLRRLSPTVALLLALGVTGLVYGRALGFPFFYDDTFDLTRTEEQSFGSLLRGIHGYAYYRPLPLLLWKALYLLQGRYDATLLHAIALVAHALAGWLLYLLLRRLTGSEWALAPMLLFLTFPFGYQVVPIVGSLFHPLVVLLMLATLYLYLMGRSERRGTLLAASAGTAVLAYWSHEFGVLVAAYVIALELILWRQRGEGRPSLWPLAHIAGATAFLLVWATVPKAPAPVPANLGEVTQKLLFYLQGMAYPATALLVPLQDRFGLPVAERTLLAGGLAIGVALLAYGAPTAILGLGWSVVALVPIIWRLNWPYVENAPRLLYLPAVGAAVFWGLLPALSPRSHRLTWVWRLATCLALALTLWLSLRTIDRRLDMLADGGRLVTGVADAAKAHPDQRLLFVNIPSWFALDHQEYARGNLGVTMLPAYIGLDRVIYAQTGAHVDAVSLGFEPRPGEWRYGWDPQGAPASAEQVDAAIRAAGAVLSAVPGPGPPGVVEVGGLARQPADSGMPMATLDAGADLLAAQASGSAGNLALNLLWRVRRQPATGTLEVVQLRHSDGAVAAEWRGYALGGIWPPERWRAGDQVVDRPRLQLTASADTGPLSVWVGLAPSRHEAGDATMIEIGTVGP